MSKPTFTKRAAPSDLDPVALAKQKTSKRLSQLVAKKLLNRRRRKSGQ